MDGDFAQKYGPWALITGASEGTGAAFAHELADRDVNCILVARRDGPLDALASEIRAKGVECVAASVDLSAPDASEKVIAAACDHKVGLLITNAGADTNGSLFLDSDMAAWDRLIVLNVSTTARNCHHFGGLMRKRGRTDTPAHRRLMESNRQPIPDNMASSDDVARVGLQQLPNGPVYNWGQSNDSAGYAPNSPDARRARIIAIEEMSRAYAGRS